MVTMLGIETEIKGTVTLAVQWDLDHHEAAVLVDGRSLADIIAESYGIIPVGGSIERDVDLGQMVITFRKVH